MPPRARNQQQNQQASSANEARPQNTTNQRNNQNKQNRKRRNKSKSQNDSSDHSQKPNQLNQSNLASSQQNDNHSNTCSICAEKAKDWAIGVCPHTVCGDCSHRMRVLYNRETCVMCNTILKQVVVVPLRHYREMMSFDDAVALPGAFQDYQVRMWFIDRSRHQQLRNKRGWMCSHKQCVHKPSQESVFANSTQLRAHARKEHRSLYCDVCFNGKNSFVSELQLYPLDNDRNYSSRLRSHLRKDHPQCRFCRNYFLDDDKLYAHLQEKHETCFICERNGRMHEYYLNYEQLQNHYTQEHYACPDEACTGIVFATQIELQAHQHTRHGDSSRGARSRALTVNLQQLHGNRDPHRHEIPAQNDDQVERERQAARRRAFLSSNVIFSGATLIGDSSFPDEGDMSQNNAPTEITVSQADPSNQQNTSIDTEEEVPDISRPDDGHFHPLALPSDGEELHARTSLLMKTLRSRLDPAAFEQFRQTSTKYNTGKLSADEFFSSIIDTFGERVAVRDILPEVVALLPSPFLREPLLDVCLRRTNTQLERFGRSIGVPQSAAGSSSNTNTEDDQFPTLTGAPAPRRTHQTSRRFGAPGPEEFPRLNRVNKAGQVPSEAATKSEVSGRSVERAGPSSSNSSSSQNRTAVQVIRERPSQPPTLASRAAPTSIQTASRRSASNSITNSQLERHNFPSLASAQPGPSDALPGASQTNNLTSSTHLHNTPPPTDISLRVGPVWGGAVSQAQSYGGSRRNRAKGRGRQPATPPRSIVKVTNADDLPDIRANLVTNGTDSASNNIGGGGRPRTLDVLEVAKARKSAVTQSSLPKVGGSGYGFAWERKKAQQKRKQIKGSIQQNNTNTSDLSAHNAHGGVGVVAKSTENGSASTEKNNN